MKPLLIFVCLAASSATLAQTQDPEIEARQLIGQYAGQLKPALLGAMSSGGPVHAVSVCAETAPEIAAELTASSGWEVRRISLRPRNQQSARADGLTREILEDFDARRAAGEPAASLEYATIRDGRFHFLKAQPVEPVCLACHGESISPEVSAALERSYPGDATTGYQLGDIRGAFYLSHPVSAE